MSSNSAWLEAARGDEAVIVNRPTDFEENGNYVIVGVRHAGKSYLLYQRVRQLQAAGKG